MSPQNADNIRDQLSAHVRSLKFVVAIMFVLNAGLVAVVGYQVATEKVVVTPAEIRRPYELGSGTANREYLLDLAGYVFDKVLTVTPETVDYNNSVILKMADPSGYAPLKVSLDAAALHVKKDKITTIWVPKTDKVSERFKTVEVSGILKTYIADKLTSENEKSYLLEFNITMSGRTYVTKMEEIIKRDASGKPQL